MPCTISCRTLRVEPESVVKVDNEEEGWRLGGDGDLARLALLVLGNDNAEQTVLHGGGDVVLVDTRRLHRISMCIS